MKKAFSIRQSGIGSTNVSNKRKEAELCFTQNQGQTKLTELVWFQLTETENRSKNVNESENSELISEIDTSTTNPVNSASLAKCFVFLSTKLITPSR